MLANVNHSCLWVCQQPVLFLAMMSISLGLSRASPMPVVGLEFSILTALRSVLESIFLPIARVGNQRFKVVTSKHAFRAGSL